MNGDCYLTRELLALGVPLIGTPIPSFKEQGWVDKKNCYFVPFDMKDVDVKQFLKIPKVTPTIKPDKWDTLLIDKPSKYKFEKKYYLVEALETYVISNVEDGELHRVPQPGEQWAIDEDRLEVLTGYNFGRRNYVKVLKEITEEEYKKSKKGNNDTR